MTNIHGNNKVIVDSDALIGLIHADDLLHNRCLEISRYLADNSFTTIVPYPIILEAATALAKDKTIRRPDLASKLLKDYAVVESQQPAIENDVANIIATLYHPKTSKKNSPFDYYVLALAKKNNISYIFSFDSFYRKSGLTLIEDVIR